MKIYSQRKRWKSGLLIFALVLVGVSLWFTQTLVNKIAQEERRKIKLWGEAIERKANLVNYTNGLFTKITVEEQKKVEIWAKGTKLLANPSLQMEDLSFIFDVIRNNETVPVILTDERNHIISFRNLDSVQSIDSNYLKQELAFMKEKHKPIEVTLRKNKKNLLYYKDSKLFEELKSVLDNLAQSFISEVAINSASVPVLYTDSSRTKIVACGNIDTTHFYKRDVLEKEIKLMESYNPPLVVNFGNAGTHYIFYKDSYLLTQLRYYPYVQFSLIGLFVVLSYIVFSTARNAEQNQVWVGMAKETAHQLGTPLSSLLAWVEYLKEKQLAPEIIEELNKDVHRLETITERFSKIGSAPKLEPMKVETMLDDVVSYLKTRTSKNIQFNIQFLCDPGISATISPALFAWVIENLWRNAVDAMNGKGNINIAIYANESSLSIDFSDEGIGIPKKQFQTIFKPGFTSKKRGWGLGLSLSKRIIENYHKGKIFVKSSEQGKGTTFTIMLPIKP